MKAFRKRTFTLPLLLESLGAALASSPTLLATLVRPDLPAALREQVMLGVTQVNDCRYCDWVHSGLALANGVNRAELDTLLETGAGMGDTRSAVAVLFAQHFADSLRRPDTAAQQRLRQNFNARERRQIMAWIHAIYFANLTGNSVDATLARLRGAEVEGNAAVQLLAALLGAPVIGAIWLNSRRKGQPPMDSL